MLASPKLAGGQRESEGKGENPLTPSPLLKGSWQEFLMLLVEREKKRKGGMLPFGREQDWFQDFQGVPLISWKS
jgi:hypothetical protein